MSNLETFFINNHKPLWRNESNIFIDFEKHWIYLITLLEIIRKGNPYFFHVREDDSVHMFLRNKRALVIMIKTEITNVNSFLHGELWREMLVQYLKWN